MWYLPSWNYVLMLDYFHCVSGDVLLMITVKRLMKSTTVENYISDMVFNVGHNVYKPQQLVWESCRDISRWKSRVMKPTVLLDLGRMKPTEYSDEVTWFSNWNNEAHDDVIKWEHFPRYWSFLGEFTAHRWLPHTKASDAELWWVFWPAPEWMVE